MTSSRLSAQDDVLARLQESVARGMGGLVDADLEETAIKLNASELQAKLQAAVVNMVNGNSKILLSLPGS